MHHLLLSHVYRRRNELFVGFRVIAKAARKFLASHFNKFLIELLIRNVVFFGILSECFTRFEVLVSFNKRSIFFRLSTKDK